MVCISPLTAIMVEQKEKFVAAGIISEFVGEAQKDPSAWKKVIGGSTTDLHKSREHHLQFSIS